MISYISFIYLNQTLRKGMMELKKNMMLEKNWMWGWMPIVAAFGRCQEDKKPTVNLRYVMRLGISWARDLVS